MTPPPLQGDVFWADPEPIRGHEQAKARPFLIVSVDSLNKSPLQLVIAVPVTGTDHANRLHVAIEPPEGGVQKLSFALPEQLRVMSGERLQRRMGNVATSTLKEVLMRCRLLLRDPR